MRVSVDEMSECECVYVYLYVGWIINLYDNGNKTVIMNKRYITMKVNKLKQ